MVENLKAEESKSTAPDPGQSLSPRLAASSDPTMLTPSEVEALRQKKKDNIDWFMKQDWPEVLL